MINDRYSVRVHADNTVTYWSVYDQCWCERQVAVCDKELAAMTQRDRERVIAAREARDRDIANGYYDLWVE